MNQIKYQVWLKDKHVMLSGAGREQFEIHVGRHGVDSLYVEDFDQTFLLSEFELRLYTCLKDKNGVGIYEGDILGGPGIPGGYRVFWNEHKAAWDVDGGTGYLPAWVNTFTLGMEVIGNVYENPDLLQAA